MPWQKNDSMLYDERVKDWKGGGDEFQESPV
jgi:hypothetical protein